LEGNEITHEPRLGSLCTGYAALRSRGLGRVLGDLAKLGYNASWTSLRASDGGQADETIAFGLDGTQYVKTLAASER